MHCRWLEPAAAMAAASVVSSSQIIQPVDAVLLLLLPMQLLQMSVQLLGLSAHLFQ